MGMPEDGEGMLGDAWWKRIEEGTRMQLVITQMGWPPPPVPSSCSRPSHSPRSQLRLFSDNTTTVFLDQELPG
jgi:hypothetical protein